MERNQETLQIPPELHKLMVEAQKLQLKRDILQFELEIKELKELLNGDTNSEEAEISE